MKARSGITIVEGVQVSEEQGREERLGRMGAGKC